MSVDWIALRQAIAARSQQIHMRAIMAAGIAVALAGQVGLRTMAAWLVVWSSLQLVEYVGFRRLSGTAAWERRFLPAAGLALISLNNLVFGAIAIAAIATGDPWAMMCGMCVLAGTVLNAGPASRTSGAAFLASMIPTAIWCATIPVLALRSGASATDVGGLSVAVVLLMAAGLMIRRSGSGRCRPSAPPMRPRAPSSPTSATRSAPP